MFQEPASYIYAPIRKKNMMFQEPVSYIYALRGPLHSNSFSYDVPTTSHCLLKA